MSRRPIDSVGDGGFDLINFRRCIRVHGIPQIQRLLEIEPELWFGARKLPEAKCGIGGHGSLPIDDLIHPGIGDSQALRSFLLSDSKRHQKVDPQNLTGVGRATILRQATLQLAA